jgi:uncharacterized protein (TIGR02600 family)
MKHTRPYRENGIALVIVLAFLVLISAITLAFFSSVTAELEASKVVANSATTHQLADSAVNVVMAQIVDATKGQSSGATLSWASQPGMIRTYDDSGAPKDFYKLYSSDKMTVSGTGFDVTTEVPPTDWKTAAMSELYTDLNAPGFDSKGLPVYPIVDPAADGTPGPGQVNDITVDGFSITSPPGYDSGKPQSTANNRAPMPVQWLYVLKDGTLKPASSPSAGSVSVAGASKTNPIVGRIAFWADDETAKVNINTASEGTYWDVPRVYSAEDYGKYSGSTVTTSGFAVCQPTQHEYQRYPGHPATTCLSPIFRKLLPVTYPYPPNPTLGDGTLLNPYYNMIPRIGLPNFGGGGGSMGGSSQVPDGTAPMVTDTDRLYASVDELMFTPNVTGGSRVPNTSTTAAPKIITKGVLEKAKFFITANSTAPETTLNNTPRVAVWPISPTRTAYDSLLAFCSTIGGKSYYFTRSNSRSGTADYAGRNVELYQYLQALTKTNVPGFGGNFLKKYPEGLIPGVTERDQILTYIYDYIRCTNLQDKSTGAVSFTPTYPSAGAGEVIPIRIGQTQGFGRFLSISSASLLFYGTAVNSSGATTSMKAAFLLQFASPMHGNGAKRSATKYVVTGLQNLKVGNTPLNFPASATNYLNTSDLGIWHGRDVCGTEHVLEGILGKAITSYPFLSAEIPVPSGPTFAFPSEVEVKVAIWPDENAGPSANAIQTITLRFPAGTFKNPAYTTAFTSRNLSGSEGGVRSLVSTGDTVISLEVAGANGNAADGANDSTAGDNRLVESLIDVPATRFRTHKDYATSGVQFAHGLLMSVGERYLGGKYGPLAPMPSGFLSADTLPWTGKMYVNPSNSVLQYRQPNVPSRVPAATGVLRSAASGGGPGDWDTGFGDQPDGAYVNKVDEGDTRTGGGILPYMFGYATGAQPATNTFFSPNRQVPSPLMLGSIPTGVQRQLPWQTLLFHPRPEDLTHPGKQSPKDHLLADLFWMPVVEPYAISQPFATNGKINLNYQIVPFTYINRSSGLYAVMRATKFLALSVDDSSTYKPRDYSDYNFTVPAPKRRSIDMAKTLAAFDSKFNKDKDIFRSASQICEMDLVPPEVADYKSMATFWNNNRLTGDNMREKPYADLYSRLTTKSNTYTVHVRVQTLRKAPGTPPDQWVAGKDQMVGEYRGSTILERYIDVNDPTLPDFAKLYASNPSDKALNIDQYYKMRVVSTKRFSP